MNRLCVVILLTRALGLTLIGSFSTAAMAQTHAEPAPIAASPAENSPMPSGPLGRRIAEARAGDTLQVEAGVYHEHLRIDKPLTLVAAPGAVIDGGGSGDIIEIAAPDVTVRGFMVRNTGIDLDKENAAIRVLAPRATIENNTLEDILFGVDLREAPDSRIIGNRIGGKALDIARRGDGLRLWRADRTLVERNVIHDGRDAILWYSSGVVVRGNVAFDCRYGLHLMFSDDITITGNEFTRNSVGIYLMYSTGVTLTDNRLVKNRGPSGYGVGLKEADRFRICDNLFVGNRSGVYLDGSPFTHEQPGVFTGNTLAYNDVGCTILPSSKGNEFSENNFIDNVDQIAVAGRGNLDANRFWKGDRGNFWSDYTGYDQNGDGVGDFVHESQTLFENLMDTHPSLRLFLFSPAQQAVEFVGRAIPAVRPEAKFTDEVPLMSPVPVKLAATESVDAGRTLLISGLSLFGLGAMIVGVARINRVGSLPRSEAFTFTGGVS